MNFVSSKFWICEPEIQVQEYQKNFDFRQIGIPTGSFWQGYMPYDTHDLNSYLNEYYSLPRKSNEEEDAGKVVPREEIIYEKSEGTTKDNQIVDENISTVKITGMWIHESKLLLQD